MAPAKCVPNRPTVPFWLQSAQQWLYDTILLHCFAATQVVFKCVCCACRNENLKIAETHTHTHTHNTHNIVSYQYSLYFCTWCLTYFVFNSPPPERMHAATAYNMQPPPMQTALRTPYNEVCVAVCILACVCMLLSVVSNIETPMTYFSLVNRPCPNVRPTRHRHILLLIGVVCCHFFAHLLRTFMHTQS